MAGGPAPEVVDDLATRILAIPGEGRIRVAVAGPPGAGKSTLAEALVKRLNSDGEVAALVPMDGFHLDNGILEARGLMPRKGAPETFDAQGVLHLVRRLGVEDEVIVPTFDRARDISVAGARVVEPHHRIAVVEGNYLLLKEGQWANLRGLWDLSISLDVTLDALEERLIQRWRDHGLDYADARARAMKNDIPNARRVIEHSAPADLVI